MMETSSLTKEASSRDVAGAAADLLDQGAIIDRLSRPLTIASLLGLIVGLGVELGALLTAGLHAGDARGTRRDLSRASARASTRRCSGGWPRATTGEVSISASSMRRCVEIGLLPEGKAEGDIEQRALGARRLLALQGSALVLQVAVVLLATALAQAHVN